MKKYATTIFFVIAIAFIFILFLYQPSKTENNDNNYEVKANVLTVNNDEVIQSGLSKIGFQKLQVKILNGEFKGEEVEAVNTLLGKLDLDNFYDVDDKIIVALLVNDNQIQQAKAIDLHRQDTLLILFLLFVVLLIGYARFVGVKAIFSFVASLYILWYVLIKGLLAGQDPLILTTITLLLLSAIIIFSVAGITRNAVGAFLGTITGLLITIILILIFGSQLGLFGMTQPYVETLIFSGHFDLNIQHIFYAAVILGASGAAMDISMDVSASMKEVKEKKPEIGRLELIQSGFNVGRAVIGTMATTLLLAYSGGYLTLVMLFMSKNSSFMRIVNLKIVAAEIMRTIIGSIGLVLVAPITAVITGWILTTQFGKKNK